MWEYSRGSSGPPGQGLRRLVGMWVCSGTNSDSKPRSSAARPSSTTSIAYSVGNIVTPNRMITLPGWPRSRGSVGGIIREARPIPAGAPLAAPLQRATGTLKPRYGSCMAA